MAGDLPKLTADQLHAHEQFAWMEITLEQLQAHAAQYWSSSLA